MTTVAVKPARGRLRVAVAGPTALSPILETVAFVRGWNVYLDGERAAMLYVGLTADNMMCGLQGAKILATMATPSPIEVARCLYAAADQANLW